MWQGTVQVIETDSEGGQVNCKLRLEDTQTHDLFAEAPYSVDGKGVEIVNGSSRLFAITVVDGSRRAVLGLGFPDRSVSFEFNVALQDFRKHAAPLDVSNTTRDYTLKDGQEIHLSIPAALSIKSTATSGTADETADDEVPVLLPPPPTVSRGRRAHQNLEATSDTTNGFDDDFGDFEQAD
jgi:hypothetical protein